MTTILEDLGADISSTSTTTGRGLELEGLSKVYGDVVVIDNLSLKVDEGKLLSLLGPSGCGKTTTLNMIAGFQAPEVGRIRLDGVDITQLPPNKRNTAIVFQNYALFPHMKVRDNIAYGLKARRLPAKDISKRVDSMLQLLAIDHLADRFPGQLSGGQQQRVSLARAVAVQPSLLLLDEPLSNLDTKLRQAIRTELRTLQQELNQTAVFVTHDQEEAFAVSDSIAVLNKGLIEQLGTPEQLWGHPETVFVANFMGVENIMPVSEEGACVILRDAGKASGQVVPLEAAGYSQVGFRPAGARILARSAPTAENVLSFEGVVTARTYQGTGFRYLCDIGRGPAFPLVLEQPTHEHQAEIGEVVSVAVHADWLLPLSESRGGE